MRPLIKKSDLDPDLLSSYRPVTNLRLLTKVNERVIFEQTNLYLKSNDLMNKYQSAYHCPQSCSVMYIGLDLSAAFDIIDHHFLFEILAEKTGLQPVVLLFIQNYCSIRLQQVILNGFLSGYVKFKTGEQQGSVLCFFVYFYMLPLEDKLK